MLAPRSDRRPDRQPDRDPALPDLRGEFEVHLTVRPGAAEALAGWAADHALKFTHILLDRGAAPSQPMLTLRATGPLDEVAGTAAGTARRLAGAGFTVLRTKIEASPLALGVPASDADAAAHGPARYFEHHVKLLIPGPAPEPGLADLAVRHGAHLSHNPRRVREDGLREWFVTQRCRRVGLTTAGHRLEALLAALAADGRRIASVEREFVAVDSDETLDAGWLTGPERLTGHDRTEEGETR
ncbi:hypothetical protein ACFXAF_29275 [Kitasatospora sp. NPDC059463]|uniref:hypothetical protein n=1 Tax=unclassified Kitasatospora TaxID=2633591 RepID=UPI00367554E6